MSAIKSVEIYQPVALKNLPEGEYKGRWSGYEATAIINGTQYRFATVDGIRTMNAKCIIKIGGGSVTVEAA